MPVAQKHRAIPCQEKMAFSLSRLGCLGTPLPLPQSLGGQWAYADVRTKILGSIVYQFCLPMVLHSAAFGCKGAPQKIGHLSGMVL